MLIWNLLLAGCSGEDADAIPETDVDTDTDTDPDTDTDTDPDTADGFATWIDTHMHLRGGGLDTLLELMDDAGVSRSILVNVPQTNDVVPEDSFCDSYAKGDLSDDLGVLTSAYSGSPEHISLMLGGASLGPVIQCTPADAVGLLSDPESPISAFRDQALNLAQTPGFIGFGEMLSLHLCMDASHSYQVALLDHPMFLQLGMIAAAENVPIDLHMEAVPEGGNSDPTLLASLNARCARNPDDALPATIPPLLEFLRETGATVVWQHIGWDNTGDLNPETLRGVMHDCESQAAANGTSCNLYFSLRIPPSPGNSPIVSYSAGEPTDQIHPDWKSFIDDYPDRIMLGADEFVGNADLPPGFDNTWSKVLPGLEPGIARGIGVDNAARVYSRAE